MFGLCLKCRRSMHFCQPVLPAAPTAKPPHMGPVPLETATGSHPANALGFNPTRPLHPPPQPHLIGGRSQTSLGPVPHKPPRTRRLPTARAPCVPPAPQRRVPGRESPHGGEGPPGSPARRARPLPRPRPQAPGPPPYLSLPPGRDLRDSRSNAPLRPFVTGAAAQLLRRPSPRGGGHAGPRSNG